MGYRDYWAKSSVTRWRNYRCLFFFLYAAVLLFFTSANSPFFAYQTWADPNIYMDVGRALKNGQVLYVDIFDHKGPNFLLLFAALAYIPTYGMWGLYLFQVVTLGVCLFFLDRLARLFLPVLPSLLVTILFPVFLLQPSLYGQGGGSAEELMLPLFMGSLFYFFRHFSLRSQALAGERIIPPKGLLFLGVSSGFTLLVKLNLSAFFFAVAAAILLSVLLNNRRLFLRCGLKFLSGVFLGMLPSIVYLTATQSFTTFVEVYLRFNLLYASSTSGSSKLFALVGASISGLLQNPWASLFLFVGLWLICSRQYFLVTLGRFSYFGLFLLLITMTYISGRAYPYEFISFLPFVAIGVVTFVAWIWQQIPERKKQDWQAVTFKKVIISSILFVLWMSYLVWQNGLYHKSPSFRQEMTGIEKVALAIEESWGEREDAPTILLFNSADYGYFQLIKTYPKLRVFYMPVISQSNYPALADEQFNYIKTGKADFVIQTLFKPPQSDQKSLIQQLNPAYELVEIFPQNIEGLELYIALYKNLSSV